MHAKLSAVSGKNAHSVSVIRSRFFKGDKTDSTSLLAHFSVH